MGRIIHQWVTILIGCCLIAVISFIVFCVVNLFPPMPTRYGTVELANGTVIPTACRGKLLHDAREVVLTKLVDSTGNYIPCK